MKYPNVLIIEYKIEVYNDFTTFTSNFKSRIPPSPINSDCKLDERFASKRVSY